ncbi:MAG: S-layer homology domain-containing protein [Clostridia bacterium]|nr:S-layer homology domain-containing protein [Clostridia bacterium]
MRAFKRMIAMVLTLIMLLSMASFPSFAKVSGTDNTSLLIALGIYDSDDEMDLVNEPLTREAAASILSVFYGVTERSVVEPTPFADVTESWSSGHIMTMVNNGIMRGYEDGLFRPKRELTYAETVKMLVTMTGHNVTAEIAGGFPTGYMTIASNIGLLEGAVSQANAVITKGQFNELLFNALYVDMLEQTTAGDSNRFDTVEGKTLLSEKLDIYEASGYLNAIPYTSVDYRTAPGSNKVRIDNINFACYLDATPYLGTNVSFYYRQAEDDAAGEILYIETRKNRNEIITVPAEDIMSVTSTASSINFTYEDENERTETVRLPQDVVVVFNGVRMTYYEAGTHLKPKQGSVKLIDADRDGTYEVVSVECYVNYFVNGITEASGEIYLTDKAGKAAITIDTKDKNMYAKAYDRGREVDLLKILEGDIVSVYADSMDLTKNEIVADAKVISLHRSSKKVVGTLDSMDGTELEIDGVYYKLASDFDATKYALLIGEATTFYLNYKDEIAAVGEISGAGEYGIVVAHDTKSDLDDTNVTLKIFTKDGNFEKILCAEKVRIDGMNKKEYGDIVTYLKGSAQYLKTQSNGMAGKITTGSIWQLVKYVLNTSGEIVAIDTVKADKVPSESSLSYEPTYSTTNYVMANQAAINEEIGVDKTGTILFEVGNIANESDYRIGTYSDIWKSHAYESVKYFPFDYDEVQVAKVLIRTSTEYSNVLNRYNEQNYMIFEKTVTKIGADGDAATFMRGIKALDSSDVEIELASASLASGLSMGDLVLWAEDNDGVATAVGKGIDLPSRTSFSGNMRYLEGTAKAKNAARILLDRDDSVNVNETFTTNSLKTIVIHDSVKGKLIRATLDDIRVETTSGSAADSLGCFVTSGMLRTVIVYR